MQSVSDSSPTSSSPVISCSPIANCKHRLPPCTSWQSQPPVYSLFILHESHPVCSDTEEKIYIWHNAGQKYYYDLSEPVRFRVESEEWNDLGPTRGNDTNVDMMGETDTEIGARKAWRIVVSSAFDYLLCHCEESQELASQIKQHGSADSIDIQGSMSHSGLGLASWW